MSAPPLTPTVGQSSGVRGDIQGLRALAVLLVVANHLWGSPVGGFVGVDVFFVVSGFLITGLLLRESEKTGRISFADFYRRRFRRIVPAATLVLVVTVVGTYALFNEARARSVAIDGIWAALFASNWRFAATETDYFAADGTLSPLQHYWSLAVEEQFYLVWPLILVVLTLTLGRRRAFRPVVFAVFGLLCVASFAYAMWHTGADPTRAYFSTFDRVWELGVGSLLAVAAPLLTRLPSPVRVAGGWGGVAVIVAAVLVIDDATRFPAPWAALPVLGAAMVIAAGIGAEQRHLVVLVNPVARYVGDISYSLYLWHFPVIIGLTAFYPELTATSAVIALVVMGVLSVGSFHLVEDPIRHSQWLEPAARRRQRSRGPQDNSRLQTQWLLAAAVLVIALAAFAMRPQGPGDQVVLTAPPELSAAQTDDETGRQGPAGRLAAHQQTLLEALNRPDYPEFDPPLETMGPERWRNDVAERGGCLMATIDTGGCSFGDGAKGRVAVLGDSMAMSYMPGLRKALEPRGYRVDQYTIYQCPAWDVEIVHKASGASYTKQCSDHRSWAIDQINRTKPDLVVLTTAYSTPGSLVSQAKDAAAIAEIDEGFRRTLTRLEPSGATPVVISPLPPTASLQQCVTRVGSPRDCDAMIPPEFGIGAAFERKVARDFGGVFVDASEWSCVARRCPGFFGNVPVKTDGAHASIWFSEALAPLMWDVMRPLLRSGARS